MEWVLEEVYNNYTGDLVGYWYHGKFLRPEEYEALFKKEEKK